MELSGLYHKNVKRERDDITEKIMVQFGPKPSPAWEANQVKFIFELIYDLRAEIESLKGKIREPLKEYPEEG